MKPDPKEHAAQLCRMYPDLALMLAEENAAHAYRSQREYWRAVLAEVQRIKAEEATICCKGTSEDQA